jgi:two-component system, response regulator PhcR
MTPRNRHAKAILFVDDEPMSTKWFDKAFGKDYTIYCANSADSALTLMQLYGDDIAIVVTDFRMPEYSGLELLRALNQTYPWVVKILVSAYADKDLIIQAVNQQLIFRVLEKPWDDHVMRRSLKEALAAFQQSLTTRDHIENSIGGMRDSLVFVATEFNAPLTVIGSCLNMIQNALAEVDASQPIPDRLKDVLPALQASQRNILACQNLMTGFTQSTHTAFASTEANPIQAARLAHLLFTEMPLSKEQQSWIQIEIKDDFLIATKQNLIYLCLTSIVQNALEALENHTVQPLIHIQVINSPTPTAPAGHSIRITDNGPGIPPDALTRIFANRTSTQSDKADNSSGLGLIFCKKIMRSLNGSISVNSTKAGTCVTLHFPPRTKDLT